MIYMFYTVVQMITNSSMTLYHKRFNSKTRLDEWVRYPIENVMWQGGKGASINKGYEKANDINVYIGNETEHDELRNFSIVTFKHKIANKDIGTIGIIGPTRMNYSKVISVMKYISKKLNGY